MADIITIKGQIEHSDADFNTDGIAADPHWKARAKAAMRHKGRRDQELARQLGTINREMRSRHRDTHDANFEKAFLAVAKIMLPAETYEQILSLAFIKSGQNRPEGSQ